MLHDGTGRAREGILAFAAGIEPAAFCSGGRRSIR